MSNTYLQSDYRSNFPISNFKILKIQDLFRLNATEVIYTNHKVNFYILMVVTADIGRHSIDYKDFYYNKGTILAIRKDQIHRFYANKNVKGYLLLFKEEFLNRYLNENEVAKTIQMFNELLVSPKTQLNVNEFKEITNLLSKIDREFLKVSDDYSLRIIRSHLHILITLIHRIKSKGYDKVQLSNYLRDFIKFQDMLEKNYSQSKKVSFYSDMLGFSSKKLNSIVKYITNKSVKVFIDDVIIIKAKKHLLYSDLSVKETAFKLGFNDPSNLYKYFKKHTKLTPEAFRKRYDS
jgi:AraC family transcriptional regulator, transcriptional activator of pobA